MRYFTFILFITFLAFPAKADIVNDFVQIQCNPDLNFLKIDVFNANGSIPQKFSETSADALWDKHKMIAVHNLFELIEFEGQDWPVQKGLSFDTECGLKTEDQTLELYKISIKGFSENSNPWGMCGGHRTITLSVWRGEAKIIDQLNFAPDCSNFSSLDSVLILPEEAYLKIRGGLVAKDSEGLLDAKVFSETFWFKNSGDPDFSPVNNDMIYKATAARVLEDRSKNEKEYSPYH